MSADDVCLTLVAPVMLRDELLEFLSEQTDLLTGFTASNATGHGEDVRLHSPTERVMGRADQVVVWIVLQRDATSRLLDRLRETFAGGNLVYWITPVTERGAIK